MKKTGITMGVFILLCFMGCSSTVPRTEKIEERNALRISEQWKRELIECFPDAAIRIFQSYLGEYSDTIIDRYRRYIQKLDDKAFQETAFVDEGGAFIQQRYVMKNVVLRGNTLFIRIFEITPAALHAKKPRGRSQ